MHALCHRSRCLAFSLLVVFMANLAAWGGGAAQMAHELGHGAVAAMAAGQDIATLSPALRAYAEAGDDSVPAAVEHQALHAVDHMQLFPPPPARLSFATPVPGLAAFFFVTRGLPPPRADQPFRPPRQRT